MIAPTIHNFISLDAVPILIALFTAVSCALMGNYLVLRKLSLMGDAISHAVLPGIVIGFLISGTRTALPIFAGAAIASLITVALVDIVRHRGKIESGASMGVVFSILFAFGVLLIEQAAARNVDLDADCVLHGQLETFFWYAPNTWSELFSWEALISLPMELVASLIFLIFLSLCIYFLWKEFLIVSFDKEHAYSLGLSPRVIHAIQMALVASCVVVAFRAVGSILVIAMLLCPAAAARLMTDKIRTHFVLSIIFSLLAVLIGYPLASFGPAIAGFDFSLSAAGTIAVVSGLLILPAFLLGIIDEKGPAQET